MRIDCLNKTYAPSHAVACAVLCAVYVNGNKLNIEDGVT